MQTSYAYEPDLAVNGQVEFPAMSEKFTGIGELAIPYGVVLVRDSSGPTYQSVKVPTSASELVSSLRGVSIRKELCPPTEYKAETPCAYLRRGHVWVAPENTLTIDTNPFVRITATGDEVAGSFRSNSDSGDAFQVSWARVVRVESGLALLEIDCGGQAAGAPVEYTFFVDNLVGTPVYGFVAPVDFVIDQIDSVLLGAALTTGNATLTGRIATTAITDGAITITQAGSAVGDKDQAVPSAANFATAGSFVNVLIGGTNDAAAARAQVTIKGRRL